MINISSVFPQFKVKEQEDHIAAEGCYFDSIKLRIPYTPSQSDEAMQKLVPEGACVGQCWRMEWAEGSQSWSRLPISPSQAVQDEPFSPLHLGLCQRKPLVPYPEEKQMN